MHGKSCLSVVYSCKSSLHSLAQTSCRSLTCFCVQVTLQVSSHKKVSTVKLTRQRITLKPVTSQMCGSANSAVGPADASGKLAYVRVATFNKQTTESAKAALRQLKADGATRQSSQPLLVLMHCIVKTDTLSSLTCSAFWHVLCIAQRSCS